MLKVKLVNPAEAAKLLGQHHGLYIERHEHLQMHAVAAGLDAGRERSRQRRLKWSSVAEPSRDYEHVLRIGTLLKPSGPIRPAEQAYLPFSGHSVPDAGAVDRFGVE